MAIVLALIVVGWLVAFALGAQTGFDNTPETDKPVAQPTPDPTATYSKPVSAS